MGRFRPAGRRFPILIAIVVSLAFGFRLPELSSRPMHADEAVLAAKSGELLETGSYHYDPSEHHGPALGWLTLIVAQAAGIYHYSDLTEYHLRAVAVVCGMVVVLFPLMLVNGLGIWGAFAAAVLTAISPAMVYYSRYFIPEMLLTALTGLALSCGYRYAVSRSLTWGLGTGISAGLMFATKETAGIAIAGLIVALISTRRKDRFEFWHLVLAASVAIAIPAAIVGPANIWPAIQNYSQSGLQPVAHGHPWHYYLYLLSWSEGAILCLAVLQVVLVVRRRASTEEKDQFLRFLAIYAAVVMTAYSLIPYKTPWCILTTLQALILLAGAGVVSAFQTLHGSRRFVFVGLLAVAAISLGLRSWQTSFPWAADARNPYAYAHTGKDIDKVLASFEKLASVHPQRRGLPFTVLAKENLWPLPWYFRKFSNVGWWRQTDPGFRLGDVVLITPEMEPLLIHEIYEVPPPGSRELYTPIFESHVELRPGVELRGYARASLAALSP